MEPGSKRAGTFVFVPSGTPHCFQNIGDTPAHILVLFSPAGIKQFFERFAELPSGPVEPRIFAELGADSGTTVLGPPLAVSNPL